MILTKSKAKFLTLSLAILVILLLLGALFLKTWFDKGSRPFVPGSEQVITISIAKGTATEAIGDILKNEGLIADTLLFRLKTKIMGYNGRYQAGDFSLSPGMTMEEIMDSLLVGRKDTVRFTIPEGYDIRRTADVLESKGLINREKFLTEIKQGDFDYWFLDGLKKDENRLEGFLFPETYDAYINASEHSIIDRMLVQFDKVFTEKHIERMKELNKDISQVLILASIIEREAVVQEDRPVIAGVFLNRLEIGMPLQSCATVQYILGEQKPVLSTADTRIESPYNTYIYAGLPPTPICSPGIASINAALWPEETDFIYFLAKGDGSHVFSKTYDEHIKNKKKYID